MQPHPPPEVPLTTRAPLPGAPSICKMKGSRCPYQLLQPVLVHFVPQCDQPAGAQIDLSAHVCAGVDGADLHLNRRTLPYTALPNVDGQRGHMEREVREKESAPFPSCLPAWVGTSHLTWLWLLGWDVNHWCPLVLRPSNVDPVIQPAFLGLQLADCGSNTWETESQHLELIALLPKLVSTDQD